MRFELGDDGVAVVTLDRPAKLNALTEDLFTGLRKAAGHAGAAIAARSCRAVLVAGAGRAFCAGMDLGELRRQAQQGPPTDAQIAAMQETFSAVEDLGVPVVAAVQGAALGAGCQLALACHLRVGAPDTRLGLLEARWGLVPDLGATWRLPRVVGLSRATDLALTGRIIDAATAAAWGLLDAVLPDGATAFGAAARAYAAALAAGPTVALGAVPALLRDGLRSDRAAALAAERAAQSRCLRSADFAEAGAALRERRDPRYTGR